MKINNRKEIMKHTSHKLAEQIEAREMLWIKRSFFFRNLIKSLRHRGP